MRFLVAFFALSMPALADPATVVDVQAVQQGDTWRFDVTLAHPDTGWDHYADAWAVVDAEGIELGVRNLAHPHVNEQPFTRSQSGIRIPAGTSSVFIRARDTLHGWGAELVEFELPK